MVPAAEGPFTLDDYVGYVRAFIRHLGADQLHVIAVCQPAVPVLAATALMAAAGETEPRSLTLMGGSIDARRSPTPVNEFAAQPLAALVRDQPDPRGPAPLPGPRTPRLSRLPAARGVHGHEPAPPLQLALGLLHAPGRRRPGRGRGAPALLRRVQRRARHAGRVLPRLHPRRVPRAPAAARAVDDRRRARRARGDQRARRCSRSRASTTTSPASTRRARRTISAAASPRRASGT